jgi:uncharacterized protein YcfL
MKKYILLLFLSSCVAVVESSPEKAIIIENQGFVINTEMGINSRKDTIYKYKVKYVENGIVSFYNTSGKLSCGDTILIKY